MHRYQLAVIEAVLDVVFTTASAMNIARNGTGTTTGNGGQILLGTTASIPVRDGGGYEQRSSRLTRCVRRVEMREGSLRQPRLITRYQSGREETLGVGRI